MSSTSSASSTGIHTSSAPKPSRFSTFKGFKLTKDKGSKPPPPPPKDPFYLRNRSLASLSPDSPSTPPHSPLFQNNQFLRRPSPNMNQSTISLVSNPASCTSDGPHSISRQREKMSAFFRLRRSPKSPLTKSPPVVEELPPPAKEDENISLPWNFQHNIHVDEAFAGMPPSWTTSLTQAGFTPAEIADMQSRRTAGTRSPGSTYFFSDRPASPAYSTATNPAVLTHPTPRSTSLHRKYSDGSLTSTTHSGSGRHSPPPLPASGLGPTPSLRSLPLNRVPSNGITKTPPTRQLSADQGPSRYPSTSSLSNSRSLDSHSHHSNGSVAPTQNGTSKTSTVVSPPRMGPSEPSTPPRRTYHVANEAVINSPPPSYTQFSSSSTPRKNVDLADKKVLPQRPSPAPSISSTPRSHLPSKSSDSSRSGSYQTHGSTPSADHSTASSSSNSSPAKPISRTGITGLSNRLTALPPRLSLHKSDDSADLSQWGEALLSGISTGNLDLTPNSSTFATAQEAKAVPTQAERKLTVSTTARPSPSPSPSQVPTARPSPPRHQHQRSRENVPPRQPPPTRPIPPVVVNGKHMDGEKPLPADPERDVLSPSSAWAEPALSARSEPSEDWHEGIQDHSTPTSTRTSHFLNALGNVVKIDSAGAKQTYGAALPENRSPILPISPEVNDQGSAKGVQRADSEDLIVGGTVGMLSVDGSWERDTSRDSSRSSTSTVTVSGFMESPTIVRNASIARRAGAYVTKVGVGREREKIQGNIALNGTHSASVNRLSSAPPPSGETKHPPSPLSSSFGSEEGSVSGSGSSSFMSQDQPTPTTDDGTDSPLRYYINASSSPDPSKVSFPSIPQHHLLVSTTDTFGGLIKEGEDLDFYDDEEEEGGEEEIKNASTGAISRPTIVINGAPGSSALPIPLPSAATASPLSPFQRYRGWLSEVVAPLEEFIDEAVDPRDYYLDLQEIAEGESGSVYAARLTDKNIHKLKLPPLVKAKDSTDLADQRTTLVAIKSVAILPSGSPKLVDLERELTLMRGLWDEHVLSMDAVYVDLVEDALWIRMELMERSLADLIELVASGLMLGERMMARFASDALQALQYLEHHSIAHRDVRSDNLLVNSHGILKLTDFSNAVRVSKESPMQSDLAGVVYWQAPEMRSPPYNALKVDVWSLGATVWEMAETEPPFAATQQFNDRWPPLTRNPDTLSPHLREFLRLCSEPPATRSTPSELGKTHFISNACGRLVIVQLLSQCMAIEHALREGKISHGPASE